MLIVEKDIWINCAPRAAFELHADQANRAAWHEHVIVAEMVTPPPLGLGLRFHHEVMGGGEVLQGAPIVVDAGRGVVTEWELDGSAAAACGRVERPKSTSHSNTF